MSLSPTSSSDSGSSWKTTPSMPTNAGTRKDSTRRRRTATPPDANGGLKWVTATNLAEFKNRDTMREVRNHVMVDYLNKRQHHEPPPPPPIRPAYIQPPLRPALTPNSHDSSSSNITSRDDALALIRGQGRRRKDLSQKLTTTAATATANSTPSPLRYSPTRLGAPPRKKRSRDKASMQADDPRPRELANIDRYLMVLRKMRAMAPINQPLVFPRIPSLAPFPYDSAFKNLTPLNFDLGRPLDPFKTLPQSSSEGVDIENLKFQCSYFFGTKAMGIRWVPAMLKERHSFLSTLFLASTQLDVMTRRARESKQTIRIRVEIIQLISQSLANSRPVIDDTTIMAVLLLACSELVRGDSREIVWHENGLEQMVRMRGGLDYLGIKPDLAVMMTIVSFLSAVTRETQPRQIYLEYAMSYPHDNFPPPRPIPESPLYCPGNEFFTIVRSRKCKAHTFELLCDMKEMIEQFTNNPRIQSEPPEPSRYLSSSQSPGGDDSEDHDGNDNSQKKIQALYSKILGLSSAEDERVTGTHGDWTYEACRIAACITATAIARRMPFSVAVNIASNTQAASPVRGSPSSRSTQPALIHALHAALEKSDLYQCWMDHHMTGVLLWITLTASAAATHLYIPTPILQSPTLVECPAAYSSRTGVYVDAVPASPTPEDNMLRKWIVAMAVRCTVLLAFEHKGGVIHSMAKFVRIGELLGNPPDVQLEGVITAAGPPIAPTSSSLGPPPMPESKRKRTT